MKYYEILDDSGVDYAFMGEDRNKRPWLGQIVKGWASKSPYDCISVEKPYGIAGTYTASPSAFREVSTPNAETQRPMQPQEGREE